MLIPIYVISISIMVIGGCAAGMMLGGSVFDNRKLVNTGSFIFALLLVGIMSVTIIANNIIVYDDNIPAYIGLDTKAVQDKNTAIAVQNNIFATATAAPILFYSDSSLTITRIYDASTKTYIYICQDSTGQNIPCSSTVIATPIPQEVIP